MGQSMRARELSIAAFQSTHPVWDGTCSHYFPRVPGANFNPPIPCGMGPNPFNVLLGGGDISIHPSRVGWDAFHVIAAHLFEISIHPSRVGWDASTKEQRITFDEFQSTHPVWDGTVPDFSKMTYSQDFNPPIPCGMGHAAQAVVDYVSQISIHPSRVGWDCQHIRLISATINFNPPIPCGMGRYTPKDLAWMRDFNPPIPCGMGLTSMLCMLQQKGISIHPSRVGWDVRSD